MSLFLLGWGEEVLGYGCGGALFPERKVLGLACFSAWFAAGFASSSQRFVVEILFTKEQSLLASDMEDDDCVSGVLPSSDLVFLGFRFGPLLFCTM